MLLKQILTAAGIALTLIGYIPYIRLILLNKTKPHAFSWIIWGSVTFTVFVAQLVAKGGIGAWPIGVSGAITFVVAGLALAKNSGFTIKPIDWLFFGAAMLSLPAWYFTADPFWAVVILTVVDLMGFGPSVRKVYSRPHEENLFLFGIFTVRNLISIPALETYSATTVMFPLVVGIACALYMALVVWRRRVVPLMD